MSRNERSTTKTSAARSKPHSKPRARPESDAARIKRQLAFLQRLQREKEEWWAGLSESERREEHRKWQRFVKSLNESHSGFRKVILE